MSKVQKKWAVLGFLVFIISNFLQAQNTTSTARRQVSQIGYRFDVTTEGTRVSPSQAELFFSSYFKLEKSNTFRYLRRFRYLEEEHIRFAHYLDGRRVIGSEIIGHFQNGVLTSFNGILRDCQAQSGAIDEKEALQAALDATGAQHYMWEDKGEESLLKEWTLNPSATYYPTAELVYAPKDLNFNNASILCFLFEIYASTPLLRNKVYINAANGQVWAIEELIHTGDANGVAKTKYRGDRNIVSDSMAVDTFRLREVGRGNGIETYNLKTGTSYAAAVDFIDNDNYWNNYNAANDEVAGDAHYGAEITYDYFFNKFNRNSYDDNGAKIRSYVHYSKNYSNAFWNGYAMTYGDGNGTSMLPLISIDICGHEIAHAVTTNSADLVYSYESGALNESFSDIFGNAIEYYADSTKFNWRMGEDITLSGNGLRNMANPKAYGDPHTYKGVLWHTSASDNGGVHTNSGVQNFWFYLLCTGKTGTNDNGDNYVVDSIGIHKAEAIAYRNLTVYLTSSSDYEEARYYAIRSAADLFGECSPEVIATTNAWYAVGVGDAYDSLLVLADFAADTAYCYTSEGVQFVNKSTNAKAYKWYFGDGDTSVIKDALHFYTQEGIYSITLIAEGCYNNVFDTIVKPQYITIDSTRDICNAILMPAGDYDTVYACNGFLYDHGGEKNYTNLIRDTITVVFGANDSARIQFEAFAYENKYDSIYVYDGYSTKGKLLGAYTGFSLPNSGNPIKIDSGAFTLRHFSDPYENELGFKLKFEAFRPKIGHTRTPDTLICYKQPLDLVIHGYGGYAADYEYYWNGVLGDSVLSIAPQNDTMLILKFGDACRREFVIDTIYVSVRDSLKLNPISDTTLCYLQDIQLTANGTGGDSSKYSYTWFPSGTNLKTWNTKFSKDEIVSLVLSDGCSAQNDTLTFTVSVRDPLSYLKSSDTVLCQGDSVALLVKGIGGLGTFSFQSSIGTSGGLDSVFSITVAPKTSGNHNFWIHFSDLCTDTKDTVFYNVRMLDSLKVDAIDTTICFGTSARLVPQLAGGNGSYLLDWGSGFVTALAQTYAPKTTQVYTIKLSDGCSNYEPTKAITVTVLDSLEVSISAKDTACFGESLSFTAVPKGGVANKYTYLWNNSGTGVSTTFKIIRDTTTSVTLTDGCSVPSAIVSKFVKMRKPLLINHTTDTFTCYNTPINLAPKFTGGSGNYVVNWDQSLGTGQRKNVTPLVNTSYTVELTDNCSEPTSATINVKVNPLPIVLFDANPKQTCVFKPITFTNSSVAGIGSKFLWRFGDGSASANANPIYWYNSVISTKVNLIVTNEFGCTDSAESDFNIEIEESPIASYNASKLEGDYFNAEISFENVSALATDYLWNFDDGNFSTDVDATHRFADTGIYRVSLVANSSFGCADTFVNDIRIKDVYYLYVPNAFTPNTDGINDLFRVKYRSVMDFNLKIYTRWGEILWETTNPNDGWDGVYNGELVPQGVYLYSISGSTKAGASFSDKGTITVIPSK